MHFNPENLTWEGPIGSITWTSYELMTSPQQRRMWLLSRHLANCLAMQESLLLAGDLVGVRKDMLTPSAATRQHAVSEYQVDRSVSGLDLYYDSRLIYSSSQPYDQLYDFIDRGKGSVGAVSRTGIDCWQSLCKRTQRVSALKILKGEPYRQAEVLPLLLRNAAVNDNPLEWSRKLLYAHTLSPDW